MLDIGLKLHFQDNYDINVATGVLEYARQRNSWNVYGQGLWFSNMDESRLNGMIARIESDEDAEECLKLGIPVVDIAGAINRRLFSTVRNDDYQTGIACGSYLRELGASNYGICLVEGTTWAQERMQGFCDAAGLRKSSVPVFLRPLPWWHQIYSDDTSSLDTFLSSLEKPVALFCCNDLCAMKVEVRCRKLGFRIPEDVAVLGVDNEELLCVLASPSLSSLQLQCQKIGYEAARMLDEILSDNDGSIKVKRVSPLNIIERQSTALIMEDDPYVAEALRLIRKHAAEGVSCKDIISTIPICRRSLEQRFRKCRKRTILEELVMQKLKLAEDMLLNTDSTLQEISEECGFSSVQRFYASFSKAHGMTPGAWRKARRA